eukprot:SM000135S26993  [mRNA]  locus=s135:153893:158121:+ [translate_table: standard]
MAGAFGGGLPLPDCEPRELEGRVERYGRDGDGGGAVLGRASDLLSTSTSPVAAGSVAATAQECVGLGISLSFAGLQDHGSSPPRRARLGWGQGLAKYERKKGDDHTTSPLVAGGSTNVGASDRFAAAVAEPAAVLLTLPHPTVPAAALSGPKAGGAGPSVAPTELAAASEALPTALAASADAAVQPGGTAVAAIAASLAAETAATAFAFSPTSSEAAPAGGLDSAACPAVEREGAQQGLLRAGLSDSDPLADAAAVTAAAGVAVIEEGAQTPGGAAATMEELAALPALRVATVVTLDEASRTGFEVAPDAGAGTTSPPPVAGDDDDDDIGALAGLSKLEILSRMERVDLEIEVLERELAALDDQPRALEGELESALGPSVGHESDVACAAAAQSLVHEEHAAGQGRGRVDPMAAPMVVNAEAGAAAEEAPPMSPPPTGVKTEVLDGEGWPGVGDKALPLVAVVKEEPAPASTSVAIVEEATGEAGEMWPLISRVAAENQARTATSWGSLAHLLLPGLASGEPLYCRPQDAPGWRANEESFARLRERMAAMLAHRRREQLFREKVLALKYRALREVWRRERRGGWLGEPAVAPSPMEAAFAAGAGGRRDRERPCRERSQERLRLLPAPPPLQASQRSLSLRLRSFPAGLGEARPSAEEVAVVRQLLAEAPPQELRAELKMPAMLLGERERAARRFVSTNGLVEDPEMLEAERKLTNPWTPEERKVFLEKYAAFNKNFARIAAFLEHKTVADCVEFYYRNQKSEEFERIRRRQQLKKRRDFSRGASYLATTTTSTSARAREARVEQHLAMVTAAAAADAGDGGSKAVRTAAAQRTVAAARAATAATAVEAAVLEDSVQPSGVSAAVLARSNSREARMAITAASVTATAALATVPDVPVKEAGGAGSGTPEGGSSGVTKRALVKEAAASSKGSLKKREPGEGGGTVVEPWTDTEKAAFLAALAQHGKDFRSVAAAVGTRSVKQCRSFFGKSRQRLGLDRLVEQRQVLQPPQPAPAPGPAVALAPTLAPLPSPPPPQKVLNDAAAHTKAVEEQVEEARRAASLITMQKGHARNLARMQIGIQLMTKMVQYCQ